MNFEMKQVFKALFIAFLIGLALAILQFILSFFGIYIIAYSFYVLSIFPSVFLTIAFEKLFGINLHENQTLFLLVVVVTIYLIFAFFIYCFLWLIKRFNTLDLE